MGCRRLGPSGRSRLGFGCVHQPTNRSSTAPQVDDRLQAIEQRLGELRGERDALAATVAAIESDQIFAEDGTAIVLPTSGPVDQDTYMPVRVVSHVDTSERSGVVTERIERPWLGVWTRPVTIDGLPQSTGLSVVRVASGSPADAAGIVPGDVIVDLAGCPLATRFCIMGALSEHKAGDTVPIAYYRPSTGEVLSGSIDLSHVVE